jgi:hypothetical protein
MEMVILVFVTLFLTFYTCAPLFRSPQVLAIDETPLEQRRKLIEQDKKNNLQAIKDIDFELATGKISPEDHQELRTLFSLKVADAIEAEKSLPNSEQD